MKFKNTLGVFLTVLLLTGCSNSSSSDTAEETSTPENPLAALTAADNSTNAYERACYWGSQGDNIFMFERIKEGNELAVSEGKLPVRGVENAMEIVLRKGEPQAPDEYEMVKDFCMKIGIPLGD